MTERHTSAAEIAALGQRVTNIEHGLQSVAEAITSLGTKIDSKTQTNWVPIWTALGVAIAFLSLVGGALYRPIQATQDRQEGLIEKLDEKKLSQREFDLFRKTHDYQMDRTIRRLDRIEFPNVKDQP